MTNTPQNCFKYRDSSGLGRFSSGNSCRSNSGNSAARLLIESRKKEELNRKHDEMQKSALMQKAKNKFEEIMERKHMRNTIKNEAVSGRRAASLNLEQRRERLRMLLEEEERCYKMEVHDRIIQAERDAYTEKIRRTQSIEMEREHERNKIVEEKRLQQFMNNYEPVRKLIMKKNHEKTFSAQLEQLRENEERQKSETEERNFWKEVDMKRLEKQKQKEEAVLQEAKRKVIDSQLTLSKQIEEKERQKAEEAAEKFAELKELEKIKEKKRLDEMETLKQKADKRNQMQKLLKEQIHEREVAIMKQNEYEKSVDEKLSKIASEETLKQRELKKVFLDEAQTDIYRFKEHLDELKQERLKEDKRYEELVESQRKYLDKLRDEKEQLKKEAQKKLEKEVLAERNMQLQMKEQKNMMEKEMRALEAQLTEKMRLENLQAEKELAQKNSLAKSKYAADLKQQMELMQQMKEKEKEEADRILQHEILAEKDYLGKAQEILNTKPDKGIHPFRVIIPGSKP